MDKLVRDRIPEIMEKNGQQFIGYVADENEYKNRLLEKLIEESQELQEAKSEEELADVLEVIEAIYLAFNFSKEKIEQIKKDKKDKRGGFEKAYILEKIGSLGPVSS